MAKKQAFRCSAFAPLKKGMLKLITSTYPFSTPSAQLQSFARRTNDYVFKSIVITD